MIFGHIDHDLGLALGRDRDDGLAFGDDLADLEPHGRHDTGLRCAKHRVLEPVACELQFAGFGFRRRLRLLRAALRMLVVVGAD